mgnify:CR=1 FL=1
MLTDRERRFLTESTRIKFFESPEMNQRRGIMRFRNIPTIDYAREDIASARVGYGEVFRQLKKIKELRRPLELDELPEWQKMIVDEHKEYGFACRGEARGVLRSKRHPLQPESRHHSDAPPGEEVPRLMGQWQRDLKDVILKGRIAPAPNRLAHFLHSAPELYTRLEHIAPFAAGNGVLTRALINYLRMVLDLPILIFLEAHREHFAKARESVPVMRGWLADLSRDETACQCGALAERVHEVNWTDTYQCAACNHRWSVVRFDFRAFYGPGVHPGKPSSLQKSG